MASLCLFSCILHGFCLFFSAYGSFPQHQTANANPYRRESFPLIIIAQQVVHPFQHHILFRGACQVVYQR